MISVVQSQGATKANGALQFVYQDSRGVLRDIFALSFQIYDADMSQVFPVTVGNKQSVDVSVGGASRVGVGRYNALWTPATTDLGRFYVHWYVTPTSGDAEISFDQEMEVVSKAYRGPHYCYVHHLREEGLTEVKLSDAAAQLAIVRASRYVEMYTGRVFSPEYKVLELDGRRNRALTLDEPIVAIEKIVVTFDSAFSSASIASDFSSVKVFNRHLTERLVSPDDRDSPRIEYIHGLDLFAGQDSARSIFGEQLVWPAGRRNIQLTGMFGYTESDGSFIGDTPALIREACKMFVFMNVPTMAATSGSGGATGPVTKERTRDQEINYAPLRTTAITGSRSVDNLLVAFRRAPNFGAA